MKKTDTLVTDIGLSDLGRQEKRKKRERRKMIFNIFTEVVMVAFFTVVLSISGQVSYYVTRYQSFFVNGMSMYPTLNSGATYSGSYKMKDNKAEWGNFDKKGTYITDYGIMETAHDFMSTIKRFDIVVTYYQNWDYTDPNDKTTLKPNASRKVKRVIAMPGETFYFNQEGDLYIQNSETLEFEYVEQPELYNKAGTCNSTTCKANTPITVPDDCYYLCGDNRSHSGDSRSTTYGPIKEWCLVGLAISIIGKLEYTYVSDSESYERTLWHTIVMPWNLVQFR
ncbi:MAG: signal peptidase I [Bacilli bacterium]|nr:signal peptidase I [Bacilli bacterium]